MTGGKRWGQSTGCAGVWVRSASGGALSGEPRMDGSSFRARGQCSVSLSDGQRYLAGRQMCVVSAEA